MSKYINIFFIFTKNNANLLTCYTIVSFNILPRIKRLLNTISSPIPPYSRLNRDDKKKNTLKREQKITKTIGCVGIFK